MVKKFYRSSSQPTMTQYWRDRDQKRAIAEEEERKRKTKDVPGEVICMGTVTPPTEQRKPMIEEDENGELVIKKRKLEEKEVKEEEEQQKKEEVKEEEEEEQKKEKEEKLNRELNETDAEWKVRVYLEAIELKEYFVKLRDINPLQEPLPGYNSHFSDKLFKKQYHTHIVTNIALWASSGKRMLDQFFGNTKFPEFADQWQRKFIERVLELKDGVLDLPIPIGMMDRDSLQLYMKGDLSDEEADFFYEIARASKFCLRFYVHSELFNYELSTAWLDNEYGKERSYGKGQVENLMIYADEYMNSQPLLSQEE